MNNLTKIQSELKAPKSQRNTFGNYNYRNCEDILEAVKPLLIKHEMQLTITDDLVCIGGRFYVKATATIVNDLGTLFNSVTAFAREEESKKGMDGAQVTGAASSYARKYALNGLFLIDDTKDADHNNNAQEIKESPKEPVKTEQPQKPWLNANTEQWTAALAALRGGTVTMEQIKKKYAISKPNQELLTSMTNNPA